MPATLVGSTASVLGIRPWAFIVGASFMLYVAVGWYVTLFLGVVHNDAISRTALASFVVHSRDPHLAAMGPLWKPPPSLVQVPLLLMLRPFQLPVFAGPLQRAAAMAATTWLLWRFMAQFRLDARLRAALLVLFALHPMVLLYSGNGMSEAMFLFFIVGTAHFFVRWSRAGGYPSLIGMALMTAGAFGVRYESLALVGAGVVALVVTYLDDRKLEPARLEAILLGYLSPVCYVVFLWVLMNALIMGDPLYFQRSVYSNTAQTFQVREEGSYLAEVVGSPLGAIRYSGERLLANFLAFGGVLGATMLLAAVRRSWRTICLAGITLSIPIFHVFLVYSGTSFGWLRFYMYSVVGAFLLAPVLLSEMRRARARRGAAALLLLSFAASNGVAAWAMSQPEIGREEFPFLARIGDRNAPIPNSRTYLAEREVATYVDQNIQDGSILIDTFLGFAIPFFAERPTQFVVLSDRDFEAVLERPQGRVSYILLPPPVGFYGQADRINQRYPDLYERGAPWATLVKDFGGETGWRLYRVLP